MSGRDTNGVRGRGFPELKNRKLKEQAVAFYSKHKVQDALEKLLNEMFLDEPEDVYGYMSEFFHGLSLQPALSTLSASEGLDSCGGKSLELDLYCTINGKDKLTSTSSVSLDMYDSVTGSFSLPSKGAACKGVPKGSSSQASLGQGELVSSYASINSKAVSIIDSLNSIRKYISPLVKGLSPYKLNEVDEALKNANIEDGLQLHPSSLLATSCATAVAGAKLSNTPLYLYLGNHYKSFCSPNESGRNTPVQTKASNSQRSSKTHNHDCYTMPIPVVGALSGGHMGCGKCRFQEYCITPLPKTPFPKHITMMLSVYSELGKTLSAKYGPSGQGRLKSGCYYPVIDKPEQALDFIQDAANNAGCKLNESIGVIVDVGADNLFDEEKGKYELISGQWRSTDDVINLYSDLLQSYPGLIGYIDPLHHHDIEGWKKLQNKLGSKCLLIADNTLRKGLPILVPIHPELSHNSLGQAESPDGGTECLPPPTEGLNDSEVIEDVKPSLDYLSCAAITMEPTLSGTMCKSTHIKGHSSYIMLRVPPNSTMNILPADLAVAMMCRFVRVGAPTGLTSCGFLSRLCQIHEELVEENQYISAGAHLYMHSK